MCMGGNKEKGLPFSKQILPAQVPARLSTSHCCDRSCDVEMYLRRLDSAETISGTETHVLNPCSERTQSLFALSPITSIRIRCEDTKGGLTTVFSLQSEHSADPG